MKNILAKLFKKNDASSILDKLGVKKSKPSFGFSLTEKQNTILDKWLKEQDKKAIEIQKQNYQNPTTFMMISWEDGYPYGGAIGGRVTYSFTPTSIGLIIKVTYSLTNETIDLTDYDNW